MPSPTLSSKPPFIPRLVLDTNVCLDAFVFEDPSAMTLSRLIACGGVHAFTDAACREEWLRVLTYPQFALGLDRQREMVAKFDAHLRYVPETDRMRSAVTLPICKDTDDQKFMELALAVGAQWLISKDNELLKLGRRTLREAGFAIVTLADWDRRFTLV
ncbi:putative toxin-antitoxin system toxin component, PIN family [Dyella sp.]|uniref:putative toxin-antitoxin system toxin component, PIN family n=1 Tax=Dyella sp. TaxID=1869338 RepID=UPI002ED042BC